MTPDLVADLAEQHFADLTDLRQAVRRYVEARAAYITAPDEAEAEHAAMRTCVTAYLALEEMTRPPAVRSIPPFEVDE